MKLLITGAGGFLGRYVVEEAMRRGHTVRVLIRPGKHFNELPANLSSSVDVFVGDLRSQATIKGLCDGVDAVLHLAASKTGDIYTQYGGTVVATENLLKEITGSSVKRIVGISSFAVYDYLHQRSYSLINEESPLEAEFPPRDEYSHTKLVQERLIREYAILHNLDYVILRPGVIYGKDNLWTARMGFSGTDKRWMRIGWFAPLPLSYVENCADAILSATEKSEKVGVTVNVLDDECPTQARYAREVFRRMSAPPRSFTVPWFLMRMLAGLATIVNWLVFRGRAKLPAILSPAKLHARFKPLRYSNQRLRQDFGWSPKFSLSESLDRAMSVEKTLRPSESGQ